MFTTPLRSENMPPIPAKISGVEKTNVDAIRSARKTVFRLPTPERVARMPSPIPSTPEAIAPKPRRLSPRVTVQMPNAAASRPTRIGQTIARAWIGGIVRKHARTPSSRPA